MTNQEASKVIKDGLEDMSLDFADEEQYEALTMAIKALEQEPSGDLISRQAVDEIKELMTDINGDTVYAVRMSYLRQLPSVKQEPCEDAISRQAVNEIINNIRDCISVEGYCAIFERLKKLPPVKQEPKTGQYERHIDHTDCIWYGSDSGCPVTCSQYRDGWNDAMDYIFKNGKGYQPYRHDG